MPCSGKRDWRERSKLDGKSKGNQTREIDFGLLNQLFVGE